MQILLEILLSNFDTLEFDKFFCLDSAEATPILITYVNLRQICRAMV
jgi:hypothetical protein